jgi:hypothetical protein
VAAAEAVKTVADLAGYSLRQEGALVTCDAKRSALVDLIDEHSKVVAPKKPWWRLGR